MGNNKVVIDIIAPNSRTFNMLEFVLQQHGKGRFELSRGNRPELVVVDFDKSDVLTTFKKFRSRFPETPAVLLLNQAEEYEALPKDVRTGTESILLKPFAAKDFISMINACLDRIAVTSDRGSSTKAVPAKTRELALSAVRSASHEIETETGKSVPESRKGTAARSENTLPLQTSTGIQIARPATRQRGWEPLENETIAYPFAFKSDIDMADDAAVAGLWLKPDNTLLGYIKNVITRQSSAQSAICIAAGGDRSLFISPLARSAVFTGSGADLLELAQQDSGKLKLSVRETAMPDKGAHPERAMEDFLWQLALYTYRGKLPEGTGVNKPVYLKYWPNLTRLEPTPDAMRIASLLSRQPVSLSFIVRILNIPQSHVFNFYAAANAIGFAGPALREVDNMLLPSYPDEMGESQLRAGSDTSLSRNNDAR